MEIKTRSGCVLMIGINWEAEKNLKDGLVYCGL